MKYTTWKHIWDVIEAHKWDIIQRRGPNKAGGSDGICVMADPLALEYQRLEQIQSHVGCHSMTAHDLEHGMKTAHCCHTYI